MLDLFKEFMDYQSDILVVVDVQPAYQDSCEDIIYEVIEKINKSEKPIVFFFVGRDLDCDTKSDVIGYLLEHGIEENRIDGIRFIEKDYGFFRSWMDCGVPHDIILKTIQYMNKEHINDTRNFNEEDWSNTVGNKYSKSVYTEDPLYLPNFNQKMFKDKAIDNFELIGGGRYECLLEIEFFLKGLNKNTFINEVLCYNRDDNKSRLHKKTKIKNKKTY